MLYTELKTTLELQSLLLLRSDNCGPTGPKDHMPDDIQGKWACEKGASGYLNALGRSVADETLMKKVQDKWERAPVPYKRQPISMLSIVPLFCVVMKEVCSLHMSKVVEMMLCAMLLWIAKWFPGFWWGPVRWFTVKWDHLLIVSSPHFSNFFSITATNYYTDLHVHFM